MTEKLNEESKVRPRSKVWTRDQNRSDIGKTSTIEWLRWEVYLECGERVLQMTAETGAVRKLSFCFILHG